MDEAFKDRANFNENISGWDMSNVTNVTGMFQGASLFNQPIVDWNVSKVNWMGEMFRGASSFNQPIGNWDVSAVTTMTDMFKNTPAFSDTNKGVIHESFSSNSNWPYDWRQFLVIDDTNFQTAVNLWFDNQSEAISTYGHISNWNVSSVTNMAYAFKDRTNFNEDISGWDMSNVTTIGGMFQGASLFNQPIGNWNVSKVEWMTEAFSGASSFNQPIGNWDVSAVHQMGYMFANATSFNQNIGDWDTSSVTIMNGMFSGATSFNKPIGNWDVSAVEAMGYMFRDAESFNQDLGGWDVSKVTTMRYMFDEASSFNQPIGNWNTTSVTNFNYMFSSAHSFNQDVSGWDVSLVTRMTDMFLNAKSLSESNKRLIHDSFSSNPNWPYDWADDETYEPGDGDGDGHETMEPGDGDGGGGDSSKPESFELELRGQVISENRPAGTEVGRFVIYNESGEDVSSDFEFEISSSSGNVPEKVTPSEDQGGEDGSSPVNGITSLTFNRQNWFTLSNVSLKMENISGGTQAFEWPKQAFSFDQRYAIDIARDDKTKAKVNDNKAGDPANLFEDWGEISGDTIRIGDNWKISSIETTNGKVEKFTIDYSMSADTEATTGTTHPSFTIDKDGVLRTRHSLDYETESSHDVTVRAIRADGEYVEKVVNIRVGDEFRPIVHTIPSVDVDLGSHLYGFSNNENLKQGQSIGYLFVEGTNGDVIDEPFVFELITEEAPVSQCWGKWSFPGEWNNEPDIQSSKLVYAIKCEPEDG
jgi:surface protein